MGRLDVFDEDDGQGSDGEELVMEEEASLGRICGIGFVNVACRT